jgi:alkylhydroperoxidase family enzyme
MKWSAGDQEVCVLNAYTAWQEDTIMSYIDTIAPAAAQGAVFEMYEHQQKHWGYVPNYAKSFSHRPEVMARWGRLLAEIRRPLDDRTFELVTFAAAHELKHTSCSLAHGKALTPFFSTEQIVAIATGENLDFLNEAEREMVRFSRQVARDASAITAADVRRLKDQGIDDATIFDIAATAAGRAFFTKVLDAVGSMPDAAFGRIDASLRVPLSVGHPISGHPDEVMIDISD